MRPLTILHRLAWTSLLCACSAPSNDDKAAASQALWQQIQAEVGDAACDGPQQCQSIAIGAKACGGPERYLAWSGARSDGKRLRTLVDQHAQARAAENAGSGRMSDCRLLSDPGASCRAGHCTLNKAGSGSVQAQ